MYHQPSVLAHTILFLRFVLSRFALTKLTVDSVQNSTCFQKKMACER